MKTAQRHHSGCKTKIEIRYGFLNLDVAFLAGFFRPFFCVFYFFIFLPISSPYLYPFANVDDTDTKNIDARPNPNKKPVMKRLAFVLSYGVSRCTNPSISIGIMIETDIARHGFQNQNNMTPDDIPTNSPVHLAHRGNCFPW